MFTAHRRPLFLRPTCVEIAMSQLRSSATGHQFAVLAYCFMPDHLHALVEGASDASDLRRFCSRFRQGASYCWTQASGEPLWQTGYYERTLRRHEDTGKVVRYLLENPMRAGLVLRVDDYEWLGSFEYSREELIESVFGSRPG